MSRIELSERGGKSTKFASFELCLKENAKWLVCDSLKLHSEMAHQRCFPCNTHTVGNLLAAVIHILQSCCPALMGGDYILKTSKFNK